METEVYGKNFEMTERLREYVDQKVDRLDRYLPSIDKVRVDLAVENTRSAAHRQVAQLTVWAMGSVLRAEERTNDMFSSIDAVLDKMHRRIERFKGKRQDKWHSAAGVPASEVVEEAAPSGEIVRVKRFELAPMSAAEAVEQMELLGHQFFVFLNVEEGGVGVVYRRTDGNYGLLQPEYR